VAAAGRTGSFVFAASRHLFAGSVLAAAVRIALFSPASKDTFPRRSAA
jgi:hypothetical protein